MYCDIYSYDNYCSFLDEYTARDEAVRERHRNAYIRQIEKEEQQRALRASAPAETLDIPDTKPMKSARSSSNITDSTSQTRMIAVE